MGFRVDRLLAVAVPLICVAGLGVGAANAASTGSQCNTLTGSKSSTTAKLGGCAGQTGGSGKIMNFAYPPKGGTVHWANGTTSTFKVSVSDQGPGTCPAKSFKIVLQGSVTASTNKSVKKGAAVAMSLCAANSGAIKNAAGTKVKF
ncbi:MAG TPA: hypothetical protein VGI86_02240 [Acidimicrobiia bacterium]|jgi:hypothetical protein